MTARWSGLRHIFRSLYRNPGYTIATVLVLGVGVGPVSLMFSTLNTVVLQPLPYPRPDRLVWLWSLTPSGNQNSTSFDDYRSRYPKGKLVDAALYWGGKAAMTAGEGMAAALLWEQLVAGYRDSALRGPALQQTAEAYAQAQQYPRALELYKRYLADYPDQARAARADIRAEQVRLLAGGEGDREAALSAVISRETGDKKRQATIDLARLYIYAGDSRAETGYRMLLPLVKEGDLRAAPQAQILVGEYFYRKGDLAEAARQFLAAALLPKVDPGVAASAIYRAAEMMQLAKRPDDLAALVKRLESSFPDSEWTVKARLLEGGAQ